MAIASIHMYVSLHLDARVYVCAFELCTCRMHMDIVVVFINLYLSVLYFLVAILIFLDRAFAVIFPYFSRRVFFFSFQCIVFFLNYTFVLFFVLYSGIFIFFVNFI